MGTLKQNLVLIRGLPGTGKSTYAKEHYIGYSHFEADMFFIGNDGVYRFNPNKIAAAHDQCQANCRKALEDGLNVVVSNTFTQAWEISPYIDMMEESASPIKLTVIDMTTEYGSIHGVPEEVMKRMRDRWMPWATISQLHNWG